MSISASIWHLLLVLIQICISITPLQLKHTIFSASCPLDRHSKHLASSQCQCRLCKPQAARINRIPNCHCYCGKSLEPGRFFRRSWVLWMKYCYAVMGLKIMEHHCLHWRIAACTMSRRAMSRRAAGVTAAVIIMKTHYLQQP